MRRLLAAFLFLASLAIGAHAQTPLPAWPSVGAQLTRDHIPPGSALEKLIRANQDFSRLPAQEAKDTGVPPWLKVLWRKSHPSGGYPWILFELHEWMVLHPDLKPTTPQVISPRQAVFSGGSNNLRISGAQINVRDESDVRVNFRNTSQIIGASNNVASGPQAQFYSTDGGLTWGQTFLPLLGADVFHGDPAVDWTSDGTAWSTTLGITLSPLNIEVRGYKSTDHGATWTFDTTVSSGQTDTDKEMMWVDHSDTSTYKDNIYVLWSHGGGIWMNRRTSSGWASLLQLNGSETTGQSQGADVKTNSAGDVFAFWPSGGNHRLLVAKSTNGGASFGAPVILGTTYAANEVTQSAQPGIPAQNVRKVIVNLSAGAYRSGSKNLVYATWMDLTGASGCTTSANAPGSSTTSNCKTRVWFSRSTDGGATWAAPVMINDQASRNDQFNPHLAVDETNGLLALTYYDTVNDLTNRVKTDIFYQSSYDDGVTWSSPFKVTTAPTDESGAPTTANNIQYGEYNGLSGYAGRFFPTWTDRRSNSGNEEIWGAALQDVNQPPVASFRFRCALLACTFDGSGSTDDQGIVSYSWSFGDGGTGSGAAPTHTYAATGRYPVTLTVTDNAGQTAAQTRSVYASGDALTANESYFSVPPCRLLDTRSSSSLSDGGSRLVTAAGACGIPSTAKAVSVVVTAVSPTGTGKLALFSGDQTFVPNVTGSALNFATATSPRSNDDIVKVSASGTVGVGATVSGSGTVHALIDVDGYFSTDTTPAAGAVGPLGYQTVTDCRLADTRPSSPLVAGTPRTFTAQGVCGIPAGAAVASVRVGVSAPATGGGFTLYPSNLVSAPGTTSLNFVSGIGILRNEARIPLSSTTPDFSTVYNTTGAAGSTAFAFFDTNGYFKSGAPLKYHPITPCRAVDTGDSTTGGPSLANGTTRTFQIQGNCGVPVSAVAAFVRLVAGAPTVTGDLTAYASNVARPAVSTIKFDAGEPNLSLGTIVPLASVAPGADDLAIFANLPPSGTTGLAIDVHGYFTN